jgi:cytoskeletal protein RodZ
VSVGEALAQARSEAGLSVAQVSQRTCIRETIVRGIERDDFSACGGDFYARGHIRSIARAVGLNPEDLVREYDLTHGSPHPITAADVFEPSTPIRLKERRTPNWTVAMVIVLALVIGYGIYRLAAPGGTAHPVAAGTHAGAHSHHSKHAHAVATPSATQSPARHDVVIRLTAIEDCWVQFTRPNGTYLSQAYVYAGSTKTWTFRHAVVMEIGNPGGIQLAVDGRNLGKPESNGPLTLSFGPGKKLPSTVSP